jgi:hypothetical protein
MQEHWFAEFANAYEFPDNYTTIDLETSGLQATRCLICTYGFTVVRNREAVRTAEAVLNWTTHPDVNQHELQMDLLNVRDALTKKGVAFHHTYEYLQQHGVDPISALNDLLAIVEDCESRGEVLIMQNGWSFDVEFMRAAFNNWLQVGWEFDGNLVWDTGIMEKASQLPEKRHPLPEEGETLQDWCYRIGRMRAKGVFWSLDKHCNERYGVWDKMELPLSEAHKSGNDSRAIHILFEEQRKLAESVA